MADTALLGKNSTILKTPPFNKFQINLIIDYNLICNLICFMSYSVRQTVVARGSQIRLVPIVAYKGQSISS